MIIQTEQELKEVFKYCAKLPICGFDTETTGLLCHAGVICGWVFGDRTDQFYIPVNHSEEALATSGGLKNLNAVNVASMAYDFFKNNNNFILGHNIKFDLEMASKEFFIPKLVHKHCYSFFKSLKICDTMIMFHILNENDPKDLKTLYSKLCRGKNDDEARLKSELRALKTFRKKAFLEKYLEKKVGNKKIWLPGKDEAEKKFEKEYADSYGDVSIHVCGEYACKDIIRTFAVFDKLLPEFEKPENKGLCTALENEFGNILPTAVMELRGMKTESSYFFNLIPEYESRINKLQEDMEYLAKQKFNPGSPIEKAAVLKSMGAQGFNPTEISAKALLPFAKANGYASTELWLKKQQQVVENHDLFIPSTDKKSLIKVFQASNATVKAFLELLQECSKLTKIITTYFRPLVRFANDGIINCSINQQGTVTGRASSNDPNMQNIPKDDPIARRGFVPRPGFIYFFFDYDQMEMRLAAHFANIKKLIELFESGLDPYIYLASIGEHIPYDKVDKKIRKIYKAVGLASIYGAGENRLLLLTDEAKKILAVMHETFPEIVSYSKSLEDQHRAYGYMEILYGRRRRVTHSEFYKLFNSKIQGAGAEILKKAQRRIVKFLEHKISSLLMAVHDELIFEIHHTELDVVPEIKKIMEDYKTLVPCTVGIEYSLTSWADKKEWKGEVEYAKTN